MKKALLCLVVGVFLGCLISEQATAQDWWNRAWNYRKKITINNAQVPGTVTNFPVLLSIASDSDLAALAKPDGSDLVIATAAGTQCPREINTWSNNTGELKMWFKAPLVSGDTDTEFYLYYGNESGNEANSTETWNDTFVAVWHMETPPGQTGADCLDSTANGNNLFASAGMVAADHIPGEIGMAWRFQGGNTDDAVAYDSDSLDITNFTVSAWCYSTDPNDGISSGPGPHKVDNSDPDWLIYGYINRNWRCRINTASGDDYAYNWPGVPQSTWFYFGWQISQVGANSSTVGWLNTSKDNDTLNKNIPVTTDHLWLADDGTGGYTTPYQGYIDEFQICNVRQPDNWMKTCYYNWSNPGAFHTLGDEEALPAAGTLVIVR